MSEFSKNVEKRVEKLTQYLAGIIEGKNGADLVRELNLVTELFIPKDVISAFENMIIKGYSIESLKIPSNKLFNLLFKTLNSYSSIPTKPNSILYCLSLDNQKIKSKLNSIKAIIKKINYDFSDDLINDCLSAFKDLEKINQHYVALQNILFPFIEKKIDNHKCLSLMWAIQDDVKIHFRNTIKVLEKSNNFDLKSFNHHSSKLYFDVNTLIFREEKVLFPVLNESISPDELIALTIHLNVIPLPFTECKTLTVKEIDNPTLQGIYLSRTGQLTTEELNFIFSTLPFDMTYVDENDEVKFYSDPPHRIFPRTPAIIGRKVQNCHPPESVHIVNQIVEEFKKGRQSSASFWINMKGKTVLIQYFVVSDIHGTYKGVLEVSQDITEIKMIEGEKRLLDW